MLMIGWWVWGVIYFLGRQSGPGFLRHTVERRKRWEDDGVLIVLKSGHDFSFRKLQEIASASRFSSLFYLYITSRRSSCFQARNSSKMPLNITPHKFDISWTLLHGNHVTPELHRGSSAVNTEKKSSQRLAWVRIWTWVAVKLVLVVNVFPRERTRCFTVIRKITFPKISPEEFCDFETEDFPPDVAHVYMLYSGHQCSRSSSYAEIPSSLWV